MSGMITKAVFYNQVKKCWIVTFTNGISSKVAYFRKFDTEAEARVFAVAPRLYNDGTDTICGFGF